MDFKEQIEIFEKLELLATQAVEGLLLAFIKVLFMVFQSNLPSIGSTMMEKVLSTSIGNYMPDLINISLKNTKKKQTLDVELL